MPTYRLIRPDADGRLAVHARVDGTPVPAGCRGATIALSEGDVEAAADLLRRRRRGLASGQFLAVDCRAGLDTQRALQLHHLTEGLPLAWIEDPISAWHTDDLADLSAQGVPVAAGRSCSVHGLEQLVRAGAV